VAPLHTVAQPRRAARGRVRLDVQGDRRALAGGAGHRHLRRQAGALQRLHGPAGRGRRGGDSQSLLGKLPRDGAPRRGEALGPHAPAGRRLGARGMGKVPRVCILSDGIYDRLVYGGKATNILQIAPQLKDRTVLVNGCSKAYAMTGLRLGWACGPAEIISGMSKVQDASTSNPSSLSQYGAVAALRGPQEPVEAMRLQFEKRRHLMVELLRQVRGVEAHAPDGAFYVFADFSGLLSRKYRGEPVATTQRLAEILLEEFGVATVPGSAFGREGYLRLSFAISEGDIRKAMERVARCASALEEMPREVLAEIIAYTRPGLGP